MVVYVRCGGICGDIWWNMVAYGGMVVYTVIYGGIWWYMVAYGGMVVYVVVYGGVVRICQVYNLCQDQYIRSYGTLGCT